MICHNEEALARDLGPEESWQLGALDKLLANFGSFHGKYRRESKGAR